MNFSILKAMSESHAQRFSPGVSRAPLFASDVWAIALPIKDVGSFPAKREYGWQSPPNSLVGKFLKRLTEVDAR